MAETITSDTSINKLIDEQKVTSQHLELFKDTNDHTQDLLLEQMVSNEELSTLNGEIKGFSKNMLIGMKGLSDSIATIKDQSGPLEVIDMSPQKLLPAPVESLPIETVATREVAEISQGEVASTPIEFTGSEFVPVVETTNQFLGQSLKNDAIMIKHLASLSDSSDTLADMAESASDVGGVEGLPTGKADGGEEEGGAGGLMDMLNPKKAFGKLGKKFPKLGKFGKILGKGLKILGPIAAAGMALFDFAKGVENAGEIVGKPMESLTTLEKSGAGLAGIIEGITFGLIDAKDAYSGIESMASTVSAIGGDIFKMMPDSVQKGLNGAVDFLFDDDEGIFGFLTSQFSTVIDDLSKGNWGDALLNGIKVPLLGIVGPDGIIMRGLSKAWDGISHVAGMIFDELPTDIQEDISVFIDDVKETFNFAVNELPGLLAEDISAFATETKDTIVGFFNGFPDTLSEQIDWIADAMADGVMAMFEGIKDLIPSVDDVTGKIGSFFGFGDDEPEVAKTQKAKVEDKSDSGSFLGGMFGSDEPKIVKKEVDESRFDSSIKNKSSNKGVPTHVNTDSVTFSKQRMEEAGKAQQVGSSQPIVIKQETAKPKKTIARATSIGDTELAMMNTNMLDA